jgi:hypothetical protein
MDADHAQTGISAAALSDAPAHHGEIGGDALHLICIFIARYQRKGRHAAVARSQGASPDNRLGRLLKFIN